MKIITKIISVTMATSVALLLLPALIAVGLFILIWDGDAVRRTLDKLR